ncbi:MAG TPA: hypothetical protein VMW01_06240 [Williamwhitmania sp.]|nr:hypothetical protein [Williamwhitmania sp.]
MEQVKLVELSLIEKRDINGGEAPVAMTDAQVQAASNGIQTVAGAIWGFVTHVF